jgi:Uma2 family endonuclease
MSATSLADIPVRPFTRKEYHTMADAGILTERDRVELIKGRIVPMMPIGPWHSSASNRLNEALSSVYKKTGIVSLGNPVGLGNDSEPQPDVTVLRWRKDYYSTKHPEPPDVLLLIEVADTSRAFDLGTKHDLYAEQGITEFWVVDRQLGGIHVFRRPRDGIFTETRLYSKGESIPLPDCAGASFLVDDSGV